MRTTYYLHDKNGNRLRCTYPNGTVNRYAFDAIDCVLATETVDRDDNDVYRIGDVEDGTLAALVPGYVYDQVGNCLQAHEVAHQADGSVVSRMLTYTYDARYQLTGESWGTDSYTYSYDQAGNRLSMGHNGVKTLHTSNTTAEG